MELRDYAKILHRNWLIVVAAALVGLLSGLGISWLTTPKFESTSQYYVSVRSGDTATSDLVQGSNFAQQAVASYVEVASSAIVLEQVIDDLSLRDDVQSLASRMSVTSPSETVLMNITVTDSDPERAAEITNAVGAGLSDVVENQIEVSSGDGTGPVQISSLQPGVVADDPVAPRVGFNGALGVFLGLVVGVALAVLRAIVDTRFRALDDLESVLDIPILGGIAYDPKSKQRPLIVHADRNNPRAESFRSLRTNLQFVATESGSRVFVVSSAVPNEGKTTTAANLAVALSETGASVVVVGADLRKPALSEMMGIEGAVGLTDVLIGRAEIRDVLQPWGRGELAVLPAGRVPPNPSELLGSKAMQRVVTALGESVDYVIIDAPPVLPVTDAAVVSRFATGTILVAAANSTKKPEIEHALDELDASGARVLGVVATKLPTKGPDSYFYGLYRYGDDAVDEESVQPATTPTRVTPKRARTTTRRRP